MTGAKFGKELQAIRTVLGALERLDDAQRVFVIRTVVDRLGIPGLNQNPESRAGGRDGSADATVAVEDPAKFMMRKKPTTDVERLTCLAYLVKKQGTQFFKTRDLMAMNTKAAGNDFSNASVTLGNAKHKGFLAKAGGGKKQLTHLGELVVEALPDTAAVSRVLSEHRPKRKGGRKGKSRRSGTK